MASEERLQRLNSRLTPVRVAAFVLLVRSDSTVLLLGETGTGKELIARAIHERGRRRRHAMVKVNCAAIPSGLLESELFGHERGAFTSAISQKIGRFELADQGSIFLDEIGDIPLELQPKLLRVLQEREYERLGSTQTRQVDVRVVAATHRNLSEMILQRQFRSDLYYRLNVFPICIPPLRERGDSASGAAFCPAVCPRDEQDHQRNLRGNNGGSHPIFVAGQHSRTAKCN